MFRLKGHQIPQGQFSQDHEEMNQSVIRPSVVVPIQPPEQIQQGALMHEDVLEDLTVSFDM